MTTIKRRHFGRRTEEAIVQRHLGTGVSNNPASAGGFAGNFYEVAYGLNYKPTWNSNFILRPELRYDWYDGRDNAAGNQPYDDGADDSQLLGGFDVIYQY